MSEYLPQDIIQQIFERLSLKTVIKCTTLSKSWRSLIKSPEFTHTYLRRTLQTNHRNGEHMFLLLQNHPLTQHDFYTLHWENTEFGKYSKLVNPLHSLSPNGFWQTNRKGKVFGEEYVTNRVGYVIGTCNGLVCLVVNFGCIIFNPSIRKLVILPGIDMFREAKGFFGFGYDLGSNDYKVLTLILTDVSPGFEVYIYSLARGSWKILDGNCGMPADFVIVLSGKRHVSVNGALHWLLERRKRKEDNVIVRFDLRSESFRELTVPERLRREVCYVSKYRECLALIRCKLIAVDPVDSSEIFMWVMNDYGVAESWTLLYSVQLQGFAYEPISFPFNGEVVVRRDNGNVPLWVDIEKNSVGEFGIRGYKYYCLHSFVESIVLLSHENAVSY